MNHCNFDGRLEKRKNHIRKSLEIFPTLCRVGIFCCVCKNPWRWLKVNRISILSINSLYSVLLLSWIFLRSIAHSVLARRNIDTTVQYRNSTLTDGTCESVSLDFASLKWKLNEVTEWLISKLLYCRETSFYFTFLLAILRFLLLNEQIIVLKKKNFFRFDRKFNLDILWSEQRFESIKWFCATDRKQHQIDWVSRNHHFLAKWLFCFCFIFL